MKSIILSLIIVFLSGCSVHKAMNGTVKPGVAYISIDNNGAATSNVKGVSYLNDVISNSDKNKANDFIKKLLEDENFRSTLFVWGADYNGAMINETGKTCMQAASYARTQSVDIDVSDALLKLYTKIDFSDGDDALLALKMTEAITDLQKQSEQSTYLSVGLFGICLLCANEALDGEQAAEAIQSLIKASNLSLQEDEEDENSSDDVTATDNKETKNNTSTTQ